MVEVGNTGILNDLCQAPGHLMRRCQQIAVSVFLDECRPWDITPLQFALLIELNRQGPDDQVGLGGALALDRTTTSVVVRKLEERGLVERSISKRDRRSKPVSITKRGMRLIRDVLPAAEIAQDRMLAPLTPTEQAHFMRLLRKMADGNNSESRAPLRR
ncbi:MAG: HTH-type transcriptional repressor NicR [Alphaproteobacteria bacterium MarineAlpha11_Bin1]|nr:MAG: HTH-type transcriptional repressor NicR [Alphaproteobacteria bacterium MarineAlpha11_Bin1]|tara:strand:- start:1757 stop:2233 length:477 start_codon:yes stop_codon:yes gene_type:complete